MSAAATSMTSPKPENAGPKPEHGHLNDLGIRPIMTPAFALAMLRLSGYFGPLIEMTPPSTEEVIVSRERAAAVRKRLDT